MRVYTAVVYLSISLCLAEGVRVCSNFGSYNNIFSKECHNNPASEHNITEVVQSWGFNADEHYVITEDGYILLVLRAYTKVTKKSPIVLVHGLGMNGLGYAYKGSDSFVYYLANLGYDVWVLNYRGSWYSRKHTSLTPKDRKFWAYSVNEIGLYDIRSTVEYVYTTTREQVIYIGYSTGGSGFFIYASTYPDEARSRVKAYIGLAPAFNFKSARSIAKYTTLPIIWPLIHTFAYYVWHATILPGFSIFLKPLMKFSWGMYLAQTVANLLFGGSYEQMDAISYPLIPTFVDTTGLQLYAHYVQTYKTGEFKKYDYGKVKNLEIYGQSIPPFYNVSAMPVPVTIYVGADDWLATPPNSEYIYEQLQPSLKCGFNFIGYAKWSHVDFIAAKDLEKYLYKVVYKKIQDIENGICIS